MDITIERKLRGRILDVGGGGEGIIGRVYGRAAVSIDNRHEELDIHIPGARIHTTYGVAGEDMAQDGDTLSALCQGCGLSPAERTESGGHFYLAFVK